MILVADSGSTKTHWQSCGEEGSGKLVKTKGMNPYTTSEETIRQEIETILLPEIGTTADAIKSIFFYGSGCSSAEKVSFMQTLIGSYFPHADTQIDHDLMGAARACCGHTEGMVAILGTGSNSCLFDGENIVENVPSLGYILCDEGAGTQIGKAILIDYLRNDMPETLRKNFANQYPETETGFLDRLYKGEQPNRFLASFALFAAQYKHEVYIQELIKEAFRLFFQKQIKRYTHYHSYTLNTVGSIGFHFVDFLREVAAEENVKIGKVLLSPLEGIVEYHFHQKR